MSACFRVLLAVWISAFCARPLAAQQPTASSGAADPTALAQKIDQLLDRLAATEARIRQLEDRLAKQDGPKPSIDAMPSSAAVVTPPAPRVAVAADPPAESAVQVRGFGDVRYTGSDQKGSASSFALGQFDLFLTSRISPKWDLLAETVVEGDNETNSFGIELERLMVRYRASDYFRLSVGRYHQMIGYYNTAYHHGAWFQTSVDRPFLYAFEDSGGILPTHNVGVSAEGKIPSGRLDLNYVVEVGNGRASRSREAEYVQNVLDENNRKSVNFALYSRPVWAPGLQVGGSYLKDRLYPEGGPKTNQTIGSAYVVYVQPRFEWLNEAVVVSNAMQAGANLSTLPGTVHSAGFYSQIARAFRQFKPYIRYEYLNVNRQDPIFADTGRRNGAIGGIRWDVSESSAFKTEYGRMRVANGLISNSLTGQLSFAF